MPDESDVEPMRLGGFLKFYVRGAYVIPLLVAPLAGLLYGVEPFTLAMMAAGFLVVTLALAAVPYRRHHAARRYEAPTMQVARGLPASALTPPDRLERMRGLGIVWWTLVLGSGAVIAWAFVGVLEAGGFVTDALLPYDAVLIVAALVWVIVAALFVWLRPVVARNARLAAQHPDALVLTAYQGFSDTLATGMVLSRVTGSERPWWRQGVPMVYTLLVDAEGIGFWRGVFRPRRQYQVPWELIARSAPAFVTIGDHSTGPQLGVELTFRALDEDEFVGLRFVEFRPARANIWVGTPFGSREVVEAVAAAIDARHPDGDQRYRGYTVDELRGVIEELEADGEHDLVAETLADVREWVAARGGTVPPGGEWLLERLAAGDAAGRG